MFFFFFFNDPATTEIYTLSLHDALPIWARRRAPGPTCGNGTSQRDVTADFSELHRNLAVEPRAVGSGRSEEHTSELQSRQYLVCRLLLEKKKKQKTSRQIPRDTK